MSAMRPIHRSACFAALSSLAFGCSEPNAPAASNSLPSLDGSWDFAANRSFGDPTTPTICGDTGTFTFTGSGAAWTGTAAGVSTCRAGTSVTSYPLSGIISAGVASADRFTFTRTAFGSSCADTAVAAPGSVAALNGTETCGFERTTWHAVRAAPVVSVSLPLTLLSVPGAVQSLDLVLRTASGQRVFARPVVWSTDNASVAAMALGVVTSGSTGFATITAVVDGRTATTNVTVLPPTQFVAVTAGDAFTCALGADQHTYCWGHGVPTSSSMVPLPVQGAPAFSSISTSQHSVCGVSAAHQVWCWGSNESGQLGTGARADTAGPVRIQGGSPSYTAVTSGGRHNCALATDGHAWCWGANDAGQLGNGSRTASSVPVTVAGALTFSALSAGDSHTCGVASGGALYCWGSNRFGQLGDSTTMDNTPPTTTDRTTPTLVQGSHPFVAVSAGFVHTCGIAAGGSVWCWGLNNAGQFGNGTRTTAVSSYPIPAATGLSLVSISSSANYSCGLTAAGDIWCWGFKGTDTFGQLGYGGRPGSSSPVKVSGGLTWASVSTGVYLYSDEATNGGTAAHTCGVTTSGTTWCWGDNLIGQLGNGTRTDSYVPIRVSGQP
jgi:alpha-tubulin suppressor-like RCC1 family protein